LPKEKTKQGEIKMKSILTAILAAIVFFGILALTNNAEAKMLQRGNLTVTLYENGCFDIKHKGVYTVRCA
jgi:hypothetical protein